MNTRILQRQIGSSLFIGFCLVVTAIALIALSGILWSLITQGLAGMNLRVFTESTPPPGGQGGDGDAGAHEQGVGDPSAGDAGGRDGQGPRASPGGAASAAPGPAP